MDFDIEAVIEKVEGRMVHAQAKMYDQSQNILYSTCRGQFFILSKEKIDPLKDYDPCGYDYENLKFE